MDAKLPYDTSEENNRGMPAFRVFLDDGTNYVTSMARGVTLAQAQEYFVGKGFEQPDEVTTLHCTKVEQVFEPK